MTGIDSRLSHAFVHALTSAFVLSFSHGLCVAIILYLDVSGRWDKYALHKDRSKDRVRDYSNGWSKFMADLVLLFLPCLTLCFYLKDGAIDASTDSWTQSLGKLLSGYVVGKIWAFGVHYVLHFPAFYHIHKRHHRNPRNLVASAAWDDSYVEYAIMELPSFVITLVLFPTHFWIHLLHFAIHGWDGACGHSGFKAPGFLGYMFDGEYHYQHHSRLTVNYAEIEWLDKICGTHHTQKIKE